MIHFCAEFIRILEFKCIPYMHLFQTEMLPRVVSYGFESSHIFGRGVQTISDTLEVYRKLCRECIGFCDGLIIFQTSATVCVCVCVLSSLNREAVLA